MLNEMQARNYSRSQKLQVFLNDHATVYNTYAPFSKEKQSFDLNFNLFQDYVTQKHTDGAAITLGQRDLKNKIALQLADICATAAAYAEQYNNPMVGAAVRLTKTDVIKQKDADVYALVSGVIATLQPLMDDTHFMEYNITQAALDEVMSNATTYRSNIGKGTVKESGGTIANQNINDVIKQLDKNVKIFDWLINRFAASHPDFVAGYRIHAALESAATRRTGIAGTVTAAANGKAIPDALVTMADKNKEATTDAMGNYAIISMYGGDYELTVTAAGYATKTIPVRVVRGKTLKLNIELQQ